MNQSVTSPQSDGSENIPMYILYVIQGFVTGGCNLLIVLCIVRYKALRTAKTFIILAGLSMADCLNQTGYFLAGIYRLNLLATGKHNTLVSPWDCFVPHNWLWLWSPQIDNLMLLVVSIDCLIAVAKPFKYLKLRCSYAFGMLGVSYGMCLCFGFGSALFFFTVAQNPSVPAVCLEWFTLLVCAPPAWVAVNGSAPQIFGVASVLLYGVIWFVYKKHVNNQVSNGAGSQADKYAADQQRHPTVSHAISSLCTLFLAVVPMCVGYGVSALGYKQNLLLFYGSFIMSNVNPLCNLFIYALRHKEIKLALKSLFTGKAMPNSLVVWTDNVAAKAKNVKVTPKSQSIDQQEQQPIAFD